MHNCYNCGAKGYWTVKASGKVPLTSSTNLLAIRSFCSEECRDEKEAEFLPAKENESSKPPAGLFEKLLLPILMLKIHPIVLVVLLLGFASVLYRVFG